MITILYNSYFRVLLESHKNLYILSKILNTLTFSISIFSYYQSIIKLIFVKSMTVLIVISCVLYCLILESYVHATVLSIPKKPNKYVIVLDAGHDGKDPGTISKQDGFEKDMTLETVKFLTWKRHNTSRYQIVLTRNKDCFVSKSKRFAIARKHNIQNLSKNFAQELRSYLIFYRIPNVMKLISADIAVLKAPDIPSILIELGFLSTHQDAVWIKSVAFINNLAYSLIDTLDNHFSYK